MRESAERSVVAVVPHPDDESYSAAGSLAAAADSGVRVCLVCATRGERGNVDADRSSELARARTAELAKSCQTIGLGTPLWLDLPDGAVDEHVADGISRLVPLLASLAPGVIVTLGEDGAYGHRDHIAVTGIVRESVARLRPRIRDGLRVLHSAFPRGVFDGVYDFHASVPTLRTLLAPPPTDAAETAQAAMPGMSPPVATPLHVAGCSAACHHVFHGESG